MHFIKIFFVPALFLSLSSVFPALTLAAPTFSQEIQDEAKGSYIFVFKDDISADETHGLASKLSNKHGALTRHIFDKAIKGFSAKASPQIAAEIAREADVLYYEPNGIVYAIDLPATAAGKSIASVTAQTAQVTPPGILRVGGPLNGTGRHAWVIDTGIDLYNPDLRVGFGANFIRSSKTPQDGNGHGTHVAGIIGAINNNIDSVGVAENATLHPVRVLDNTGSGTIDGVVAGVNFVALYGKPGDVANMSLGAPGHFRSLHDAIVNTANLGIKFAVAAGNEATSAMNSEPAHINHPNVYTVSAVDQNDVFAWFSNYGNPPIDFAAPGVNIVSNRLGGGVVSASGTSMAAPHVAGLLLLGQLYPSGTAINDPDGIPDPIAHH